jgi:hypothetical protein
VYGITSPLHTLLDYNLAVFPVTFVAGLDRFLCSVDDITYSEWMGALHSPLLFLLSLYTHSWIACPDDLTVILWGDPRLTPSRMSVPGNLQPAILYVFLYVTCQAFI